MHGHTNWKLNKVLKTIVPIILFILLISMWNEIRALKEQVDLLKNNISSLEEVVEEIATVEIPIFFQCQTETDFFLSSENRRISKVGSFYENVVRTLIDGPSSGSGLMPTLPKETLLRRVEVKEDIAYVDLGNIIENLNVGSMGEALVVFSVVNTLAQIPGINAVQILVDGTRVETLAGHLDIYEPLEPSWALVKW